MTRARFADTNEFANSAVTLTASGEATGYGVARLTSGLRWKPWRSTTTTGDQWIKSHRVSTTGLTCALLTDVRAHVGGTLRFQAHTSDAWGAPNVNTLITLPALNPTGVVGIWFTAKTETWLRFYFTNSGAVNSYVQVGVAFVGTYTEPAVTIAEGFDLVRHDLSTVSRAIGGEESSLVRRRYSAIGATFGSVTGADKTTWRALYERVGMVTPFFFAIDGDDPDFMFYTRVESELGITHLVRDRWNVHLALREAL